MGAAETITKEFLEKCLNRKISNFRVSGGSNPGDNYVSVLYSVEVTIPEEEKPLHLLFKTFPSDETRQKLLLENNIFLKEYQIYHDLLAALVQSQDGPEILKPCAPELVAGAAFDYVKNKAEKDMDPYLSNFLLMTDMRKPLGYKMADKFQCRTFAEAKVTLEELAKLHALGLAYKMKNNVECLSKKFDCVTDPFFSNPDQRVTLIAMTKSNVQMLKESLKEYLKNNLRIESLLQKLEDKPATVPDTFATFLNPKGTPESQLENLLHKLPAEYANKPPIEDQWISVCHGDCWTNNLLYKYNASGEPESCCLVDFQVVRESCITADIAYFLYNSTDAAFRAQYLKELLIWYHDKFIEFCKALNVAPFPGFTLENLERKYHRSKLLGFYFAFIILFMIFQKPEGTVDMQKIEVENEEDAGEGFAEMFTKMARDDQLLARRFSEFFTELQNDGVM